MASYPNSPFYPGQRTPGVVVEFTTGDPSTSSAFAGTPVSAANPFPVTIISGGGGGGGNVNLTGINGTPPTLGAGANIGGLLIALPNDQALSVSGNVVASGTVAIDQTTDGTTNAVHLKAGTAIAGKFGVDQTTPGTTNAVQIIPGRTGGLTKARIQVPNSTTGTSVVAGARQLYHWSCFNNSAVPAYAKLYDKATAPVVASDTPVWEGIIVAPAAGGGGGFIEDFPMGLSFALGIAQVVTLGYADTDATAPAANAYILNLAYSA